MKMKYMGVLAISAIALTACNSTPQPKELSEFSNATMQDSLAYYMGEQGAMNFWRSAMQDTTLKTDAAKASYLKGFQKGMDMVMEDEAYNQGLIQGVNLANYLRSLNKDFELDLQNDRAVAGLAYGMQNDTIVNPNDLQQAIMPIGMRLEAEKAKKDKAIADQKIDEEIKKSGYKKDANGIVYKVVEEGKGKKLENDEYVLVQLTMTDLEGNSIVPTDSKPQKMTVGKYNYSPVVNRALPMMNIGSTYKVIGSSTDIFGPQARQFRLKDSDVVCVEIKVTGYCNEKGEPSDTPLKEVKAEVKTPVK